MRKPSHIGLKLGAFAGCALILLVWQIFDLPCLIRACTGVICPGCGMSRAWRAALRLDLAGAFSCHPMFWAVPVLGVYVFFDCRLLPKPWQDALVLSLVSLGVAVCYAFRLAAFLKGDLAI